MCVRDQLSRSSSKDIIYDIHISGIKILSTRTVATFPLRLHEKPGQVSLTNKNKKRFYAPLTKSDKKEHDIKEMIELTLATFCPGKIKIK